MSQAMKDASSNARKYFDVILGEKPWRARLGIGSFLTFDFGPRQRNNGHFVGKWRLWIYQAEWILRNREKEIVTSESERRYIALAVRRLENEPLSDVVVEPSKMRTEFRFGSFQLLVRPATYLSREELMERDHYWFFFMPGQRVLTFGPGDKISERSSNETRVLSH
jgi:hypothetical protein